MFSMLWKEWRENRAMLLAVLVAVLALLPALRALDIIQDFSDDYLVSQIVIVVLSACIGASLVGSEVSRGTLELLWTRPGPAIRASGDSTAGR
jgi:ABC-type transport system involved in multi-copper enzyme maturation permease subunit